MNLIFTKGEILMVTSLEKGRITSKQLMYTVATYIFGGTLYMSFAVALTKQDTWFTVITGFTLSILFAWIIISLLKKFPGKTLIQVNDIVFGNIIGKIISSLYLFYFLVNPSWDIREIGDFITNYIMPETPIVIIIGLFTLVCIYAVHKGISTIIRNSFLIGILLLIVAAFDSLFLIPEMDFGNFIPMFNQPIKNYFESTLNVSTISFDGVLALAMIFPFVKDSKDFKKPVFLGIVIGAILVLWIVIRDWAVLGETYNYLAIPSFHALRLVKIGQVFTRVEIVAATMLMAIRFFRISILCYCLILGAAQLFKLKSYRPIVCVMGIIIASVSTIFFDSISEAAYFNNYIGGQYIAFFVFVLPSLTLIITKIKSKKLKNKDRLE